MLGRLIQRIFKFQNRDNCGFCLETRARGRHQHASIFLPRSSILCYSLTLRRGRENHLTSCRVFESGNSSSQLSVCSDHLWDDNSSNMFRLLFISTLICGVDQLAHTSACVTAVTGARVQDVACRILSPVTFPAVTLMFNMLYKLKSVYCPVHRTSSSTTSRDNIHTGLQCSCFAAVTQFTGLFIK